MSQSKSVTLYGLAVEAEASYGAGGTIVEAEDGVELAEEFVVDVAYMNDGARPMPPGSVVGHQKRGAPSGRMFTGTIPVLFRGAGAAYSATVTPEIHDLLRACGHSATLDVTAGSESYTYAPEALQGVTPGSVFADGYARGQLWPLTAIYGSFGFVIEGPGYMRCEFESRGRVGDESDVALPAITYPTVMHPKAEGMSVALGNWTAGVVSRLEFRQNRALADRLDVSGASTYAGVANGRIEPSLVVTVEAESLATSDPFHTASTFNPYKLYDQGVEHAISFDLGVGGDGATYNRLRFTASQAQLSEYPVHEEDGPTARWRLTYQLNPSSPTANDPYTLVAD